MILPTTHVLISQQFKDTALLTQLFKDADRIACLVKTDEGIVSLRRCLNGTVMYQVFYESSTRTRFSFWAAARMLGMDVCFTESAGHFSSAAKGETLEHTIRVLCGQNVHAIVLRHPDSGAAQRAATVVDKHFPGKVAIVNAGDGGEQHPTQALLDAYTIWKKFGRLDNLCVGFIGDAKNGRTIRSLAYLLSKFSGIRLIFTTPPELKMRNDVLTHLTESGVEWKELNSLAMTLAEVDVAYCTRVQKERLEDQTRYPELRDRFHIGLDKMVLLKKDALLMHPLPIDGEIAPEVDDHPQAIYFEQANNGQFVRAALLLHIFGIKVP